MSKCFGKQEDDEMVSRYVLCVFDCVCVPLTACACVCVSVCVLLYGKSGSCTSSDAKLAKRAEEKRRSATTKEKVVRGRERHSRRGNVWRGVRACVA